MAIASLTDFYVSPADFVGHTGNWYSFNGTGPGPDAIAFVVVDPMVGPVMIWDETTSTGVTNSIVPRGDIVNFLVNFSMFTVSNLRSNAAGDVDQTLDFKVRDPTSGIYTSLYDSALVLQPLTGQFPDAVPATWTGLWDTGAAAGGTYAYPPGTYTVWAESTLNSMKDNYKDPGGADYAGKTVSFFPTTVTITWPAPTVTHHSAIVIPVPFRHQSSGTDLPHYKLHDPDTRKCKSGA
jgi:hypothetical protein